MIKSSWEIMNERFSETQSEEKWVRLRDVEAYFKWEDDKIISKDAPIIQKRRYKRIELLNNDKWDV